MTDYWLNFNDQTHVQLNLSSEASPFAQERWLFKKGGLSLGVEINTLMFRFTLSSGLSTGAGP